MLTDRQNKFLIRIVELVKSEKTTEKEKNI